LPVLAVVGIIIVFVLLAIGAVVVLSLLGLGAGVAGGILGLLGSLAGLGHTEVRVDRKTGRPMKDVTPKE
jgi:hypothetical protein